MSKSTTLRFCEYPRNPESQRGQLVDEGGVVLAYDMRREVAEKIIEAAGLEGEIRCLLDETLPRDCVVRVREGGGPENIAASLAVSIAKLQKKLADAETALAALVHPDGLSSKNLSTNLDRARNVVERASTIEARDVASWWRIEALKADRRTEWSCGCVSCTCADPAKCHGCGARKCDRGPACRRCPKSPDGKHVFHGFAEALGPCLHCGVDGGFA